MKKVLSFAAALGSAAFVAGAANAAVVNCGDGMPDVTGNVSGTSACQFSDAYQNDSLTIVNSEGFFGFSDWKFDSKDEFDNGVGGADEGADILKLSTSGNIYYGSWSLTVPSNVTDVMLVFKDGVGANPSSLVAYLISATSGTFKTPFFKDLWGDKKKGISHISVYYRTGDTPPVGVSEPGMLALMAFGMVGFAGMRRFKR